MNVDQDQLTAAIQELIELRERHSIPEAFDYDDGPYQYMERKWNPLHISSGVYGSNDTFRDLKYLDLRRLHVQRGTSYVAPGVESFLRVYPPEIVEAAVSGLRKLLDC